MNKNLWGGRFQEPLDQFAAEFTASVSFDKELYVEDITASCAHVQVLKKANVLSTTEAQQLIAALKQIQGEIASGEFTWSVEQEDVHSNIETRLIALVGDLGKKLHTGRSRNDQVATDTRLYLRNSIDKICLQIKALQAAILLQAEHHVETIMPGYTHMQHAQPISCAQHLLAWWQMLQRDHTRLRDCQRRANECPLGAAALAGSGYPLDRHLSAQLLGFAQPMANSLDAVSARDHLIEFAAAAAILVTHLSRISEELVLWSSSHFRFVVLADAYCTGSSIMPQKKNPDIPELVRGKSGRVIGNLNSLLVMLKATPLAYNKDFQEDKQALFDSVHTVSDCLHVYAGLIASMEIQAPAMRAATELGYLEATDLADYLVRKAIPFRDAHSISGRIVALAIAQSCNISELSLADLQSVDSRIEPDIYSALTLDAVIAARAVFGGTALDQVRQQLLAAQQLTATEPAA